MHSIGIRELKIDLSRYIKKLNKLESLLITDRGKPVAKIVPVTEEENLLWKLSHSGQLNWKGGKPKGAKLKLKVKGAPLAETVIKERALRDESLSRLK